MAAQRAADEGGDVTEQTQNASDVMAVEDGQRGGLLRRHEGGGGGGDGVAGGSVAGARATREREPGACGDRTGGGGRGTSSATGVTRRGVGVVA